MNIKIVSLGLLIGFISGLFVTLSTETQIDGVLLGLLYGIVTAPFFAYLCRKVKAQMSIPLWILASGLSYYAGLITTMATYQESAYFDFLPFQFDAAFFFGGASGAFILLLCYHFLFKKVDYRLWMLTLLVAGTCAGIAGPIPNNELLYASWQTLVTGLLASSIDSFPNTDKNRPVA
jgi:hypothetical protein